MNVIESLKGKVSRVVITDLKDTTFFANTVEGSVNDWSTLYLSSVRGLFGLSILALC